MKIEASHTNNVCIEAIKGTGSKILFQYYRAIASIQYTVPLGYSKYYILHSVGAVSIPIVTLKDN